MRPTIAGILLLNMRSLQRVFLTSLMTLIGLIGNLSEAKSASMRCPGAEIVGSELTSEEKNTIQELWRDLDPKSEGGDGPLGCPRGQAIAINDSVSSWIGVGVPFQRGWIYVGRGPSAGSRVVGVRGLGQWTIWWSGLSADLEAYSSPSLSGRFYRLIKLPAGVHLAEQYLGSAAWRHSGYVAFADSEKYSALWDCQSDTCQQKTPTMDASGRPFDVAARLGPILLSSPEPTRFADRIAAIFPPWFACFTRTPNWEIGETSVAHATILMRGTEPCPITGLIPRELAVQWLKEMTLGSSFLPGSTYPATWPCGQRNGELDVALLQVLHLVFAYRPHLDSATISHLQDLMLPWGGLPREDPYITPEGTCGGYQIIETENHILMQETARYLINALLRTRSLGSEYDNNANRTWLSRFLQQIARRDFYEFNSIPYTRYQLKALLALHNYAPDSEVHVSAKGLLDWLFIKHAVSGSMDRDYRPYRRRPESGIFNSQPWWGSGATASTIAASVLAGPFKYANPDIDLEINDGKDEAGVDVFHSVDRYPDFGTISEYFLESFIDLSNMGYGLPNALAGWLHRRFTSDDANRMTFVQIVNHATGVREDQALFKQTNSGVEIVSGNRNWTIVGGGTPGPPGDPGPVPHNVGASLIPDPLPGGQTFARNKQTDKLWEDQPSMLRETILIPSAGGLDRNQTFRFGKSMLTPRQDWDTTKSRLCVAEGFMCGYDLTFPSRPFPESKSEGCPIPYTLPSALETFTQRPISTSQGATPLKKVLGCFLMQGGNHVNWPSWSFEYGMLTMNTSDPAGSERLAATWVENATSENDRALKVSWQVPGRGQNWYRVHTYSFEVQPSSGEPPGGWHEPLFQYGDPESNKDWDSGEVTIPLRGVGDVNWDILLAGCDRNPTFPGHDCQSDIFPKLNVSIAIPPKQAFSCAAHYYQPPFDPTRHTIPHQEHLVLEVGSSCSKSPYGFYAFIKTWPCYSCHGLASNYGFIVVAPSRGWSYQEFEKVVMDSMSEFKSAAGHEYLPTGEPSTIAVPLSPPVVHVKDRWESTANPSTLTQHTITFQWPRANQPSILKDTSTNTYDVLQGIPYFWPSAVGHVTAPDSMPASSSLLTSNGDGCFTFNGIPMPNDSDPMSLVVDLRLLSYPRIEEVPASKLFFQCNKR